jgi:DNA modification methylase
MTDAITGAGAKVAARYYIDCFTAKDAVILDPFMGGGTTAYVCNQLGRPWLGFELDPANVEIAQRRLASVQPLLFPPVHQQLAFEDAV